MKLRLSPALAAALIVTGGAFAPATVMAEEPAVAGQAEEVTAKELETLSRARIKQAQAEAAQMAAEAVMLATKLDLDIRLLEPTSVISDL